MEKSKKVLIMLLILLIMIGIIVFALIQLEQANKSKTENDISQVEDIQGKSFEEIKDYKTYFSVKEVINNYITYMKQINGDEYVDTSRLNMTKAEIAEAMQEDGLDAIKSILDDDYKKNVSDNSIIQIQNQYKQNGTYDKEVTYSLNIDNVYECQLTNNIIITLAEAKLNGKELNVLVKFDNKNNTYSMFLDDYVSKYNYNKNMDKKDFNISKNEIIKNSYNNNIKVDDSEVYVITQYFSDFRMKMLNDTEVAYRELDSDYAQKKFGDYSNFQNYINENKESITYAGINKYQVVENSDNKEYICIDENGKYYIFVESGIGKYTVVLDTYTIDLPEFLTKYNSSNERIKVGMNIQKVFDAINDKDYEFVYNKLDSSFKQNNFKTLSEFKDYAEKNFVGKQLKYDECQQQGSIYVFNITITDGTNQTGKNVIMKLLDGTDFVMSFNK